MKKKYQIGIADAFFCFLFFFFNEYSSVLEQVQKCNIRARKKMEQMSLIHESIEQSFKKHILFLLQLGSSYY